VCDPGGLDLRGPWAWRRGGVHAAGERYARHPADAAPAFTPRYDFTARKCKSIREIRPGRCGSGVHRFTLALNRLAVAHDSRRRSTSVAATSDQIDALTSIPANANVRLAITAVGTTFPGADLSVFVYSVT